MSNKPKVLATTEGGTGLTTTTAHLLLCSTATNVLGEVTNGTTGQLLQATATTPNFATVSTGGLGVAYNFNAGNGALAASTTYYYALNFGFQTTQAANTRLYIPVNGTIKAVYGVYNDSVGASAGNCTLSIRLNNTTDTTVTSTLSLAVTSTTFNNTGLSISVSAGDYIEMKLVTPAWVTPPSGPLFGMTMYME